MLNEEREGGGICGGAPLGTEEIGIQCGVLRLSIQEGVVSGSYMADAMPALGMLAGHCLYW